ncbi:hypothetical protein M0804_007065 [Polistes exclamans]|nr:hypothetical protein M0804_007065 [Polistes exclamans]
MDREFVKFIVSPEYSTNRRYLSRVQFPDYNFIGFTELPNGFTRSSLAAKADQRGFESNRIELNRIELVVRGEDTNSTHLPSTT